MEDLSENANYKSTILQNLSNELGLERSILARCLYFFETYKILPKESNLTWSHYRELLGVKDENLRNILQIKASEESWTTNQLIANIKNSQEQSDSDNTSLTTGIGMGMDPIKLIRPTDPTYLYKATVSKVVDGDTLILLIDLGFKTFREQRVRLAGINCPEIDTDEGKKAWEFTIKKLAGAEFVMVKTHKIDIYGRYLGHIFYDVSGIKDKGKIFSKGNYLNMEILDAKFAEVMLF
jgi:endonuclease YncB( thermonuclease family)